MPNTSKPFVDPRFVEMQTAPFVIPVIGGKGGIGKSLVTQLIAAKLRTYGKVQMIDTDHTNSSTKTIDPEAMMVDLWDTTARGSVAVGLKRIATGACRSIAMDTGAQEDRFISGWLKWLAQETAKVRATLAPVLPITLSSHNQLRAVAFAEQAAELGLPVLLVRNLGQGRKASDYAYWNGTKTRQRVLDGGAVEIDLPDLGARWTDEASGLGLSLADVAQSRFERAGAAADAAREIFNEDVRSWLNIFIGEFGDTVVDGLIEAITKRRKLDGKA